MDNRLQDHAFVVVALEGNHDARGAVSLWPTAPEAERHIERLLEQGVLSANIRVFHAQHVELPSMATATARDETLNLG